MLRDNFWGDTMEKYHKIQTVFKRNPDTKFRTLLIGEYALPEFEYLRYNNWTFTEKVDGTNIRVFWRPIDSYIKIGGRTDNAQIATFLYDRLSEIFTPVNLQGFDEPITFYGEGFGAKIQKGGGNYNPKGVDFVLFDVRCGDFWLKREDVIDVAHKLGIGCVPIIGRGTLPDMVNMAQTGIVSNWGNFSAEGIVARPDVELFGRSGHRIITKIKIKDFKG